MKGGAVAVGAARAAAVAVAGHGAAPTRRGGGAAGRTPDNGPGLAVPARRQGGGLMGRNLRNVRRLEQNSVLRRGSTDRRVGRVTQRG